jgi:hypothetical protein
VTAATAAIGEAHEATLTEGLDRRRNPPLLPAALRGIPPEGPSCRPGDVIDLQRRWAQSQIEIITGGRRTGAVYAASCRACVAAPLAAGVAHSK